jgi:hypothetical protein
LWKTKRATRCIAIDAFLWRNKESHRLKNVTKQKNDIRHYKCVRTRTNSTVGQTILKFSSKLLFSLESDFRKRFFEEQMSDLLFCELDSRRCSLSSFLMLCCPARLAYSAQELRDWRNSRSHLSLKEPIDEIYKISPEIKEQSNVINFL